MQAQLPWNALWKCSKNSSVFLHRFSLYDVWDEIGLRFSHLAVLCFKLAYILTTTCTKSWWLITLTWSRWKTQKKKSWNVREELSRRTAKIVRERCSPFRHHCVFFLLFLSQHVYFSDEQCLALNNVFVTMTTSPSHENERIILRELLLLYCSLIQFWNSRTLADTSRLRCRT